MTNKPKIEKKKEKDLVTEMLGSEGIKVIDVELKDKPMTTKKHKLSNCCRLLVKVVGGDEGTNHYECQGCRRACDIYVKPTTKEKCSCPFSQETAREIGHYVDCPLKDEKTWWQEDQNKPKIEKKEEKDLVTEMLNSQGIKVVDATPDKPMTTIEKWENDYKDFCKFIDLSIQDSLKEFIKTLISDTAKSAKLEGYEQGRIKCLQQHDYGFRPAIREELKEELLEKLKETHKENYAFMVISNEKGESEDWSVPCSEITKIVKNIK